MAGVRTIFVLLLLIILIGIAIWLIVLNLTLRSLCPKECWCNPEESIVDCADESLQEIPKNSLQQLNKLILSKNEFEVLVLNSFINKGYTEIEHLYIDECKISDVRPGAFNNITIKNHISLGRNKIQEIQHGVFNNLTRLNGLYLGKNKIQEIAPGIFNGLKNLTWINLESNLIKQFQPQSFFGLTNLKQLRLSSNKLTNLHPEVFKEMPKLELISLDDNELHIPANSPFLNIPTLRHLNLSESNINLLTANSFKNMTGLLKLELQNNKLKTFDISILSSVPNLSYVMLFNNPLECDCNLQKLYKRCRDLKIQVGIGHKGPKCHGPQQVFDMWWEVLEKAQCREGVIEFQDGYKSVVHKYIPDEDGFDEKYEEFILFITYGETIIFICLFIFGAAGNVILLLIIMCNKDMRTVPNTYILNLAISDLLSLIMRVPFEEVDAIYNSWLCCYLLTFLSRLSITVSAYSVAMLSIQRYQVLTRPLRSRIQRVSARKSTALRISGVWILAIIFALPCTLSVHIDMNNWCTMLDNIDYYKKVVLFELIITCFLPLIVTISMYAALACHLVQSTNFMNMGIQQTKDSSRKSAAKSLLSLAFVFMISFVPHHLLWNYLVWNDGDEKIEFYYILSVSTSLLLVNACFNPIALFCYSSSFKAYFKYYICRCCTSRRESVKESYTLKTTISYRDVHNINAEIVL